jgi:Mat/Ecp fimbriae major subunit
MKKLLAGAGAIALLAMISAPAQAVSPASQATASAKIYRPLTIALVQNLDFGTVVLAGSGSWSGEVVSMSQAGAVTCGGGTNLSCSGSPQAAKYHLVGSNNAVVTISSPGFNLTGPGTLAFTPNAPATVNLGASGASTGVDFAIGGSITLASTTPDGLYSGTFNVTADYQ